MIMSGHPVDLHSITTLKAFPHLKDVDKHSPEFKHHRRLGKKMCNFLKNYGGGTEAIKSQLGVTDEVANLLNRGYYEGISRNISLPKMG